MGHQLSVARVLHRDWPSFVLSVFIALFWLVAIGGYIANAAWFAEKEGWLLAHFMAVGALAMTVIGGAVVIWRIHLIRHVFARGEVVRGQVIFVGQNAEDINYAVITYRCQEREYQVKNTTQGAADVGAFKPGDAVDIVVDPRMPSRAFIAKLYLE